MLVIRSLVLMIVAGLAWLGLVGAASAADGVTVRAGRLVDVLQGRVLRDQAVRIEAGRVVRVVPWSGSPDAAGSYLDWSAYTVVPGLMDMHTHLVGDIQSSSIAAPLLSTAARDVLAGAANARATLRAGFTTVRDVGAYRGFTDVALRDAIAAGQVEGPRMFVAGAYVTITGGGGEVIGYAPDTLVPAEMRRGVADTEAEVRQRVREILAGGANFIKIIATGAVLTAGTTPAASEYSESEIRAAVAEAATRGSYVVAHAHGAEGIRRAIRAGVRSVEHASYLDDEGIALMRRYGTWLVADVYNGDYIDEVGRRDGWSEEILRKNRETTDIQREAFTKALRAGVKIAYGTDAGVYPHGQNGRQFAYMVRFGMTPMQAIQAATINAARLLGQERDLGAVAAGRKADLVAVAGDPLVDISVLQTGIVAVMKDGVVVHERGRALP